MSERTNVCRCVLWENAELKRPSVDVFPFFLGASNKVCVSNNVAGSWQAVAAVAATDATF